MRDSTGLEAEAAVEYQRALDLRLPEPNRGRTFIQYASTLRNLGRYDEGAAIAIAALAPHLPRYQRSMKNYATELLESS